MKSFKEFMSEEEYTTKHKSSSRAGDVSHNHHHVFKGGKKVGLVVVSSSKDKTVWHGKVNGKEIRAQDRRGTTSLGDDISNYHLRTGSK
jgi:hypothetical protein